MIVQTHIDSLYSPAAHVATPSSMARWLPRRLRNPERLAAVLVSVTRLVSIASCTWSALARRVATALFAPSDVAVAIVHWVRRSSKSAYRSVSKEKDGDSSLNKISTREN